MSSDSTDGAPSRRPIAGHHQGYTQMMFTLDVSHAGRQRSWQLVEGTHHVDLAPVVPDTGVDLTVTADGIVATLTAASVWRADLHMTVHIPLSSPARTLWPTYQGLLERRGSDQSAVYEFRGPGWNAQACDDHRLGIPAVIVETNNGHRIIGTDPGFSAHIATATGADGTSATIDWTYRHQAGRHNGITRRIINASATTIDHALAQWFQLATPDVPAGPAWLHDIAWTNYDYMSKNGQGWYQDIDAFCALVGPDNHQRAAFTLHGWYDTVGRYCYDQATNQLDETWTVFPYMNDPRLLAREGVHEADHTHPPAYTFRNLASYTPMDMDWNQIRQRINYAKDRGLRVPFYLITGVMALGDRGEHAAAGDGLDSESALWIGPDAVGETHLSNPLHPVVRSRLLGLTQAVLEKVGDLIDALVIDEAYYIGYGQLGPPSCPGYADLAQATLLKEMADLCHAHRPDIALLSADHLGTQFLEDRAYPYALFTDGIYHDAWCHAQTWPAGRFPAWRNTIWSCNWAPATAIGNTKWAVLAHDAPIATGNGCFGDDIGIADMSEQDRALLHRLWTTGTNRNRTRHLTIVDVT